MEFEDKLRMQTPEGVTVDVTLAGAGSRGLASIVDLIIQILLLAGAGWLTSRATAGGWIVVAVGILVFFVIFFFYYVAFESLWAGRSPGKRMMGLRVLRLEGQPVTFTASMIRNLLRLVDFLPFAYGVAIASVLATSRNQRLGDMAAGTIVVRDPPHPRGRRRSPAPEPVIAELPPGVESWDVGAITQEEVSLVRRFLERRSTLEVEARYNLARQLESRLRPRVGAVSPEFGAEMFLELLAAAKASRT